MSLPKTPSASANRLQKLPFQPTSTPDPPAQPLEPILFPKLRIYFADFPYLHYPIRYRLLTLDTWCGYRYGLTTQRHISQPDFHGAMRVHQTPQKIGMLYHLPLRTDGLSRYKIIPGLRRCKEEKITLPNSPTAFSSEAMRYRIRCYCVVLVWEY